MGFPIEASSFADSERPGNLAAVLRTMGHKDVIIALQRQHPGLEILRRALDQDAAVENPGVPGKS